MIPNIPAWLSINKIMYFIASVFLLLTVWSIISLQSLLYSKESVDLNGERNTPTNHNVMRKQITNTHFFGRYVPDDERGFQKADLDFELVGVLLSEDPNSSQVIVRHSNRQEKFYHMGETLPGGAMIKKVTKDSVIILFDGKLQQLILPKDTLNFESKPETKLIKE